MRVAASAFLGRTGEGGKPSSDDTSAPVSAFDIVFGKPSAPTELYEKIANESRAAMMAQVALGNEAMDLALAGLYVCSEDDAIKTRTHIPLPVDAFSERLDNMVAECKVLLPAGLDAEGQLQSAHEYLFGRWGLKLAKGMSGGEYSPYRVYMNNCLTQRCGTPSSCAALLSAFLLRLRAAGALPALTQEPSIGLPADSSLPPIAVVAGTEEALGPLVRWTTKVELLAEMLDQLKRFYWSWDWTLGTASGFDACASALLGETGRAGTVNAAVGVIQPTGRPFGDVGLSVLATERQVMVTRALDPDSWAHAIQVRDLGALNIHIGKRTEGLALLESYEAWLQGKGSLLASVDTTGTASTATSSSEPDEAPAPAAAGPEVTERYAAPVACGPLVSDVLLYQRKKALESSLAGSGGGDDVVDILSADD